MHQEVGEIEFEYATSMADSARQFMAHHRVPPSPRNFEVWFTYAAASIPELTKALNVLIAGKRAFDAAINRSLYTSYIAPQGAGHGRQSAVSEQLEKVLASAQGFLKTALSDNRDHLQALGGVASHIEADSDPRAIIASLMEELSKAVARASDLKSKLDLTSKELEDIRTILTAAEQRSKIDPLTGLGNRLALDEFLRAAQIAAMETGEPLSLLLIDIDHFKKFNDDFGHRLGDQVLRLVAEVLKSGLRENDLAVRYGGEEMLGILPGADLATCRQVAERIRQSIAGRRVTRRATGELLSNVTVSIGVAEFMLGETVVSLFERCDRALYAAKHGGRNRTVTERELDRETVVA